MMTTTSHRVRYVRASRDDVAYDDRDDDDATTTRRELVAKAQRKRLMREIMREQRELIERESSRADDAEEELLRVTAQAEALSLKLDAIEESYARRASAATEATETATTTALANENERLRSRVKELEQQVAQLQENAAAAATAATTATPAKSSSTASPPLSAEERRTLLRELAEAKKDVALAKEARAKALAETIELRAKLEHISTTSTPTPASVSMKSPPKTPEWVNVEWDASYGGADAKPTKETPAKAPQLPTDKIDWDAAYAEIDAIRSSKKWSQ